jgi:invasion protein IalB
MLRIAFALLMWALLPQTVQAGEWDQSFGDWQLYCVDTAEPAADNCSVSEYVYDKESEYLVRIVMEATDIVRLKIELPIDSHFVDDGGGQVVRAHIGINVDDNHEWWQFLIKECSVGYCETFWLEKPYFPRESLTIQLKREDAAMRIEIPMEGFHEAVKALEERIKINP